MVESGPNKSRLLVIHSYGAVDLPFLFGLHSVEHMQVRRSVPVMALMLWGIILSVGL